MLQGVLDDVRHRHRLEDSRDARVGLLHGHDILDVLDVVPQVVDLRVQRLPLGDECLRQAAEVGGNHLAAGVLGQESGEVGLVLVEQRGDLGNIDGLGMAHVVADEGGRDIDAVEHVADVVEHTRGHIGHAGLAGRGEQFPVHALNLEFHAFALLDFLFE